MTIIDTKTEYDNYENNTSKCLTYAFNYLDIERSKRTDISLSTLSTSSDGNILFNDPQSSKNFILNSVSDRDFHTIKNINSRVLNKVVIISSSQIFI